MEIDFLLIDVFTDQPFGGSRLYLFPDGAAVPARVMQQVAMELGAGETAFIVAPREKGTSQAGLRVFTPAAELPFGAHSLLGATFALEQLGRKPATVAEDSFMWDLESGSYKVLSTGEGNGRLFSLVQDPPQFMGQYFHRGKVARALGLSEEELAITGLPCEIISTGLPIHIVPVGTLEAMERIALRKREADAIAGDLGFGDLFVFTCETVAADATVHCRMFAPHFGIPEDPASGAATGSLIAYMVKHRLIKMADSVRLISEQGLEMGRPSRLVAEADVVKGQARTVRVGGCCVLVGSGRINIP